MIIAAIIAMLVVAACCQAAQPAAEGNIKVNVRTQRGMYSALAFVVKEQGYLEEEGLDVERNWFSGSPQVLEAMEGGSIDVGLPVGTAPGQVGVGNGLPVYIISNNLQPNEEWYYKVGEWLDEWGYTKATYDEYLPEYLSKWKEIQTEAGVYKE